ncbi:hypothetical protein RISK_004582 [Rhodopirellula islandica]|uniref:Uncharacterized protein n=1 Tax=Rhodopirellula islandica TaxID=595434 RepID=A0A0J1B8W3_RHOIS|nr:hypothetical protein RISK_004582 [Rhodopirellula islandica]
MAAGFRHSRQPTKIRSAVVPPHLSRGATASGQPWVSTQGPSAPSHLPSRGATTVDRVSQPPVATPRLFKWGGTTQTSG